MSDEQIIEFLRSRARTEPPPGLTDAVMAGIDAAPSPRSWFAALVPVATPLLIVAAVAVALLITVGPASIGPAPSSPSATASPAFPIAADDPRFAACAGTLLRDKVIAAFPFVAADYHRHFPKMGLSPELQQDVPAFAVVFMEGVTPPGILPGAPVGSPSLALESPAPLTGHTVCVYVGQPPDGTFNFYADVDITGMKAESQAAATSTPSPRPTLTPASSPPPGYVTVEGPISVLANKKADALFKHVRTCVSEAGYTVKVPAQWYTNEATRDTPACSWFAPQPFDGSIRPVVFKPPPPDGVWITLEVFDGSAGYTSITPVYMSESVSIGGYEGHRAEFGPMTADEIESRPEYRAYHYIIPLWEFSPTFIAGTNVDVADDYPLAKAVLDRIVASITFDQP